MKLFKVFNKVVPTALFIGLAILAVRSCKIPSKPKEIRDGNIPVDNHQSSSMDICPKNLGTVTLEDLGIQTDLINEVEDEYWELEQIGDKYYRVRKEDCEKGYQGKYEEDEEILIGNFNDLHEYFKNH